MNVFFNHKYMEEQKWKRGYVREGERERRKTQSVFVNMKS